MLDRRRRSLLDHMGQLVSQKLPPTVGARAVLPRTKRHVVAERERASADRLGRPIGATIGMDSDLTEVGGESRLEEGSLAGRERLASSAQRLDGDRGRGRQGSAIARSRALRVARGPLVALGAHPPDRVATGEETLVRGHPHHLGGDAIGLALLFIVVIADRELRLQCALRAPHRHRPPQRIVGIARRRTAIGGAAWDRCMRLRGRLVSPHRVFLRMGFPSTLSPAGNVLPVLRAINGSMRRSMAVTTPVRWRRDLLRVDLRPNAGCTSARKPTEAFVQRLLPR